jgi:hypothetical protein
MKCPKCQEEGKKSILYDRGGSMTCMGYWPYYDEEGIEHIHNPNWHRNVYECSNGHLTETSRLSPCPAKECDYGKE